MTKEEQQKIFDKIENETGCKFESITQLYNYCMWLLYYFKSHNENLTTKQKDHINLITIFLFFSVKKFTSGFSVFPGTVAKYLLAIFTPCIF